MTYLSIEYLRDFAIVRPAGSLGTVGWQPRPWQCAIYDDKKGALRSFLEVNPQWRETDIVDPRKKQ